MKRIMGWAAALALLGAPTQAEEDEAERPGAAARQENPGGQVGPEPEGAQDPTGVMEHLPGDEGLPPDRPLGHQEIRREPGAGEAARSPAPLHGRRQAEPQVMGEVVKVTSDTVYIDHFGAVVPLRLTRDTRFGSGLERREDLKEGQQIRASFSIEEKERNVVSRIGLAPPPGEPGVGGTGLEQEEEPFEAPGVGDPTEDPTIIGNERADRPGEGAVFDTGDTSGRAPATIPEGDQPGPASPLPGEGEIY